MSKTIEKQDYQVAAEELAEFWRVRGWQAVITGGEIAEDAEKWRHRAYRVKIITSAKGDKGATFDWRAGLGIKGMPNPAEVLACVCDDYQSANAESFEDWASNLGYDADSRKAEKIWRDCLALGEKLNAIGIAPQEIEHLAGLHCRL